MKRLARYTGQSQSEVMVFCLRWAITEEEKEIGESRLGALPELEPAEAAKKKR